MKEEKKQKRRKNVLLLIQSNRICAHLTHSRSHSINWIGLLPLRVTRHEHFHSGTRCPFDNDYSHFTSSISPLTHRSPFLLCFVDFEPNKMETHTPESQQPKRQQFHVARVHVENERHYWLAVTISSSCCLVHSMLNKTHETNKKTREKNNRQEISKKSQILYESNGNEAIGHTTFGCRQSANDVQHLLNNVK